MITKVILYIQEGFQGRRHQEASLADASNAMPWAMSAETAGVEAVEAVEEMEVQGLQEEEKEDDKTEEAEGVPEDGDNFYVEYDFKMNNKNDLSISPFIPDIFYEDDRLDALEGIANDPLDYSEHLAGDLVDTTESASKVVDGLKGKASVWARYGAGKMNINIIEHGIKYLSPITSVSGPRN